MTRDKVTKNEVQGTMAEWNDKKSMSISFRVEMKEKEQLKDVTCNAQWTSDCCGKQDLDFGIITADTRYWPNKSVVCHIEFMSNFNNNACIGEDNYFPEVIKPVSLARSEIMKADSEEEAKLMARRWYNEHVIEAMEKAIKIIKGETLVERGEED